MKLKQIGSKKKGLDTDTYWFDEINKDGKLVAKYIIKDSTSIYPPQTRTITFEKYSIDGNLVEDGRLK